MLSARDKACQQYGTYLCSLHQISKRDTLVSLLELTRVTPRRLHETKAAAWLPSNTAVTTFGLNSGRLKQKTCNVRVTCCFIQSFVAWGTNVLGREGPTMVVPTHYRKLFRPYNPTCPPRSCRPTLRILVSTYRYTVRNGPRLKVDSGAIVAHPAPRITCCIRTLSMRCTTPLPSELSHCTLPTLHYRGLLMTWMVIS
jgi:hypothetical protein